MAKRSRNKVSTASEVVLEMPVEPERLAIWIARMDEPGFEIIRASLNHPHLMRRYFVGLWVYEELRAKGVSYQRATVAVNQMKSLQSMASSMFADNEQMAVMLDRARSMLSLTKSDDEMKSEARKISDEKELKRDESMIAKQAAEETPAKGQRDTDTKTRATE